MKNKQKILLFVAFPIALIAGLVYWLGWSGSTDHIESVADQFKADSSWKLVSSDADPPRTLCIAQVCPRLSRTWTTPQPITQEELADILQQSKWDNMRVDDECLRLRKDNPKTYICPTYVNIDRYQATFYATDGTSRDGQPSFSMHLE